MLSPANDKWMIITTRLKNRLANSPVGIVLLGHDSLRISETNIGNVGHPTFVGRDDLGIKFWDHGQGYKIVRVSRHGRLYMYPWEVEKTVFDFMVGTLKSELKELQQHVYGWPKGPLRSGFTALSNSRTPLSISRTPLSISTTPFSKTSPVIEIRAPFSNMSAVLEVRNVVPLM